MDNKNIFVKSDTIPSSISPFNILKENKWENNIRKRTSIHPEFTFDMNNLQIKEDIIRMIVQYLQEEGYFLSSKTIQDETKIQLQNYYQEQQTILKISKAIKEGEWDIVKKLVKKNLKKNSHSRLIFLYNVHKQEYFELIDQQETEKALEYLITYIKPMEYLSIHSNPLEFHELCYLLTCKSVNDSKLFNNWENIHKSREKLADLVKTIFEFEVNTIVTGCQQRQFPPNRLISLLHQAVAYQMEFSRYHPKTVPKVNSLLNDFECEILPNTVKNTFIGHKQNIKCVTFLGKEGEYIASGSSDNTIKIWRVETESQTEDNETNIIEKQTDCRTLIGHNSRIWDLCSNKTGNILYSASGDGTVKVWNLEYLYNGLNYLHSDEIKESKASEHQISKEKYINNTMNARDDKEFQEKLTISGHGGDIYSVSLHPCETHIVTGGYDQKVRLFDVKSSTAVKTLTGHSGPVCGAIFNSFGNLVISAAKDGTIRFWDILSGLNIRTLRQTLGEITSVQLSSDGFYLLSGSKNNSNRLWDIRMAGNFLTSLGKNNSKTDNRHAFKEEKPIQRFKGHQNTAKNIVRASFGPRESLVLGGSEDGFIHVWDVNTGKLLERLPGHDGVVYSVRWHEKQALMATCSDDLTVKTWWWHEKYER